MIPTVDRVDQMVSKEKRVEGKTSVKSIVRVDGSAPALTVEAIVRFWREASEAATRVPQPIRWVVFMRPEIYSQLLPMRRRKLQPYIRSMWAKHSPDSKTH